MAEQYWEQRDCAATWVVSATTLLTGEQRGRFDCAHSTSTNKTPAFPPHCIPSRGHSDSVGAQNAQSPQKGSTATPNSSTGNPPRHWPGPNSSSPSTQSSLCLYWELTGFKHRFLVLKCRIWAWVGRCTSAVCGAPAINTTWAGLGSHSSLCWYNASSIPHPHSVCVTGLTPIKMVK